MSLVDRRDRPPVRGRARRLLWGATPLARRPSAFARPRRHRRSAENVFPPRWLLRRARYLVDPASNHMLVSKIKPCTSKYKPARRRNCERLIKSVTTLQESDNPKWITCGNSGANTCNYAPTREGKSALIRRKPFGLAPFGGRHPSNLTADRTASSRRRFFEFLIYHADDGSCYANQWH